MDSSFFLLNDLLRRYWTIMITFYLITTLLLLLLFCLLLLIFFHHRRIRHMEPYKKGSLTVRELDTLDGIAFEELVCEILCANDFELAENTPASRDFGVDILARKDGMTYAIQCKCYTAPVGVKAVQEAYAGRDYYDRMVGAVLTNQYFTASAVEAAKKLKILLWDRDYLEMMEGA